MTALFIASPDRGNGKTAVAAGIGQHLIKDGKKVGFFKPVIGTPGSVDSDAEFLKQLFALDEPAELISPIFRDENQLKTKVKEAYNRIALGKDVVIIESSVEQVAVSREIAATLDARVILVDDYAKGLKTESYQDWGKFLLGVVVNKVPKRRLDKVRPQVTADLNKAKVNLSGILPEDRFLLALTVGELAGYVHGEIRTGADKAEELVENLMAGAMLTDYGPDYFSRKKNKAVIVRCDRPDMQLAALATPTAVLVLTGKPALRPVVLFFAEEKKTPIILTPDNIETTVANIENSVGKTRFNQTAKLPKLTDIMEPNLDFRAVYKGLEIAG